MMFFAWGCTATTYNAFLGWEFIATSYNGIGFFGWEFTATTYNDTSVSLVVNAQLRHTMETAALGVLHSQAQHTEGRVPLVGNLQQ